MSQVVQAVVPFGKYDLVASLGRGGMAEIFLAHERGQEELVVIKRVLPHLTTEMRFLEMLVSEAKVASLLSHPGIVRILGLGQEEGQFYLAMEYVPGWNVLNVAKAAGGRVPPLLAASIGQQVAAALSHAHRQTDLEGRPLNLVHRDVTPGNVMVTPMGEAKLIDFGIAKAATQLTKTAPGILKGKLRFVSPEQVRQEPVDARSDLFSLGVSLYEITTGTQPFGCTHAAQTLQAILDFEPPRPRSIIPDFPEDLEEVVLKSLEKHPDDRYPDAQAMADALAGALRSGPEADLGAWLRELASRKPDLLPPPRDPMRDTVPLTRPRAGTKDKIKVSNETVRLPQLEEDDAPPPRVRELAQTRPMSRQEIAKHVEADEAKAEAEGEGASKPAEKSPTPQPQPRTRTQDRKPVAAPAASTEAPARSRTAERRAAPPAPEQPPAATGTPARSRTAERRAAPEQDAASAEPAPTKMPTPAGRPRTAERRAVDAPATPVRSRSSDRRPVAADPEQPSAALADRLTPTATATSPTASLRSRSSDRAPVASVPADAASNLADRLTPTATATATSTRPRTSDRSPVASLATLPPEEMPTTTTVPGTPARSRTSDKKPVVAAPAEAAEAAQARPRTRSQDRKPAVPAPEAAPRKSKGPKLPQWLVGFLLGLVGVLGVGLVAGAIYWLTLLRK
ncbi:MAG TPA: protein kinase [Myxococcales bacterium]